jgi:exonuclease VII small subunit
MKKPDFETSLEELEEIVGQLETNTKVVLKYTDSAI